jgi:hypothetical protein
MDSCVKVAYYSGILGNCQLRTSLIDETGIIQYQLSQYSDGLRATGSGFDSRQGNEIFVYSTASRPALGPTQPPIQWVPGNRLVGVKWPERESNHSPPSTAEVKNGGAVPSLYISSWHGA